LTGGKQELLGLSASPLASSSQAKRKDAEVPFPVARPCRHRQDPLAL